MDETLNLMSPLIQYGFAGMSLILIAIVVWLIRRLLDVLRKNGEIISRNTGAIETLNKDLRQCLKIVQSTHEMLLVHDARGKKGDL